MPKKNVFNLVGGKDVAMSIITSLAKKAKAKGLSDEDFHLLAKPKGEPLLDRLVEMMVDAKAMTTGAFKVTVDYSKSLAEMVSAGKYVNKDFEITPERFPHFTRAPEEVEIRLFHFDREIMVDEVIVELEKKGFRPANLAESLALAATYPDLQQKHWFVVLGSGWWNQDGIVLRVVFGNNSETGRQLYTHSSRPSFRWYTQTHFAAVRK